MYTYSTTPLETINTYSNHTGFIIFSIFIGLIFFLIHHVSDDINEKSLTKKIDIFLVSVYAIIVSVFGYNSFTTGQYHEYENEKVEVEFVQYVAEGFSEKSGKTRSDRHYVYAEYKEGDNNFLFRINSNEAWPKKFIAYKNKKFCCVVE